MADSRLRRLLSLILILRDREWISADEISERFNISLRTVYRDMEALQSHGIPVKGIQGRDGGYRLEAESPLSSLDSLTTLGSNDALILLILRALVKGQGTKKPNQLAELFDGFEKEELYKLNTFGERIYFDTQEWYWKDGGESVVPKLRHAVLCQKRLITRYIDKYTKKTNTDVIDPYGLVWKGGHWYLVGAILSLKKIQRFRASRIQQVIEEGTLFNYPPGFDLKSWWKEELESFGKGDTVIRLIVDPSVQEEFLQLAGKKETQLVKHEDSFQITLYVDRWEWLIPLLLSFGGSVVVKEPNGLRDELIKAHMDAVEAQNKLLTVTCNNFFGDIRSRATRGTRQ